MAWRKQLKANFVYCIVFKDWLGCLLICDLCISWICCSSVCVRGLTALGLKLGSAFGKTEDVLDVDSVSGLAGSHSFFFPLRGKLIILFGERYSFEGEIIIYLQNMHAMSCCYDLKRNKQVSYSVSCAPKALSSSLCGHASHLRLSPFLRYPKDKLPCLYLGLWLSEDLRIRCYHLPEPLCIYNIMGGWRWPWSEAFLLIFLSLLTLWTMNRSFHQVADSSPLVDFRIKSKGGQGRG